MANMARRKAQMRGRALSGGADDDGTAGAAAPEDKPDDTQE